MATIKHEDAAFTIVNFAKKFRNIFSTDAMDIEVSYKDDNGDLQTATLPNIGKMYNDIKQDAVVNSILGTVDEFKDSVDANKG